MPIEDEVRDELARIEEHDERMRQHRREKLAAQFLAAMLTGLTDQPLRFYREMSETAVRYADTLLEELAQ